MASSAAFRHRFGSLIRAYQLVGYTPRTDYSFLEINRYLRGRHPEVVQEVITRLSPMGVAVERDPATQLLILDHEYWQFKEGGHANILGMRWTVTF